MNGWLVIGCTLDRDVPLGFFIVEKMAERFAKEQSPATVRDAATNVFRDNVSEVFAIHIVPLRCGKFGRSRAVVDFSRPSLQLV